MIALFIPAIVIGLVIVGLALLSRTRDSAELSVETLFRVYLYVASFVSVGLFAFGAAALLNALLSFAFGNEFAYGAVPSEVRLQHVLEMDRRRADDIVRGLTFALFGGVFWLIHWFARNRIGDRGALQRGYLLLGTLVFGIGAGVLLPTGVYQALSQAVVPSGPFTYQTGPGEALSAGIVSLAIWSLFLRIVLSDLPGDRARPLFRGAGGPVARREEP